MKTANLIIACKIFEHELKQVLPQGTEVSIHWIDAALHADSKRMKKELETAIAQTKNNQKEGIYFLFGQGCHPDMCEITKGCGGQIPHVKNCIEAIIGPEKTKQLEANRTMIMTRGWIKAWPGIMEGLGWDEVDVRMNLGRYSRILVLDSNIIPLSDEEILNFFDLVQVPIEIEPVNLVYFQGLVERTLGQN